MVMRQVIADEGIEIPGDVYIAPGAIWWEETDIVPLTNGGNGVVGLATNLRREDNKITAEVDCNFPPRYVCSFFLNPLEKHIFKGTTFVTKGRIQEVNVFVLVDEPGDPNG